MKEINNRFKKITYTSTIIALLLVIGGVLIVYYNIKSLTKDNLSDIANIEHYYITEMIKMYEEEYNYTPEEILNEITQTVKSNEAGKKLESDLELVVEKDGYIIYLLDDSNVLVPVDDEKNILANKAINSDEVKVTSGIKTHRGKEVYAAYKNIKIGDEYTVGLVITLDKTKVIRTVIVTGCVILIGLVLVAAVFGRLFHKSFASIHKKIYKERERALEANEAKTQFLARMSHELRTPMNAIVGLSDLVLERSTEEVNQKYLKIISDSSKNLLGIINDILDYSKIEIQKLNLYKKQFNLDKMLHNIYELMSVNAEVKGVVLQVDKTCEFECDIIADESRITQILINLLSNAIKFTNKGKKVQLIVSVDKEDAENASITFQINDEGIGIEDSVLEKVFEPFHQADEKIGRQYGGTGLGLAITKALVEIMGGKLEIKSAVGEGTSINVVLPIQVTCTPLAKEEKITRIENTKILVVDDMFPNRLLLKEVLETKGINVVEAENGREAIEILEKTDDIDLVLMDIQMPGLNGYQTTELIRKFNNNISIIAVSADALQEHIEKALKSGMNDYVTKPIDFDLLTRKIKDYCNKEE